VTELTKIASIRPIPEWMFRELPHVAAKDPAAVTWTCGVHGEILPKQHANGWTRRQCDCEQAARWASRDSVPAHRSKQPTSKVSRTYTWLGPDGEELGLEEKTLSNFDPAAQPKVAEFKAHLATAKMYASQIVNCSTGSRVQLDNLIIKGPYGTGKTHLAAAILNELRAHGIGCLFCTAQNLFNALYAADFDEKQSIIAQLGTTPLAVIDELDGLHLGRESNGEFQRGTLFDILNRRYQRKLPTILITNVQDDLSPWLDGKTTSRLLEHMTVLKMTGVDYRLAKPAVENNITRRSAKGDKGELR
jgi:DNA replication protein DnaC